MGPAPGCLPCAGARRLWRSRPPADSWSWTWAPAPSGPCCVWPQFLGHRRAGPDPPPSRPRGGPRPLFCSPPATPWATPAGNPSGCWQAGVSQGFSRTPQGRVPGQWVEAPPDLLQVREMDPGDPDHFPTWEGLTIKSVPANHIPGSLSYRVEAEGAHPGLFRGHGCERLPGGAGPGRGSPGLESSNPFKVPGHLTPASRGPGGLGPGCPACS